MKLLPPEKERIDDLRRGGQQLIQNSAAPCFAIDALLLADFCQPKAADRLLELGSGTGVVSLLLAAKQPNCQISALELMPQMADLSRRNVALNGLERRITVHEGDIRQADQLFGKASFDVLVSNPPYYAVGRGRANQDQLFAAARSEQYCTIDQLAAQAALLLKPLGSLYLVHRASRLADVLAALLEHNLRPQILRPVQPFATKPANLFLLQAVKQGQQESKLLPPLVIYESEGVYGAEMRAIYGADS